MKNQLHRAWFYPLTVLTTIGLSVPLQADETPFQLNAEQSGAKYGAVAYFCEKQKNTPRSDTCGIGYSNNQNSQEEANQQAIEKCGVSGCEAIVELTNACGVILEVSDTWEDKGETIGYGYSIWSGQEDAEASPLLADLVKGALDYCNSYTQEKAGKMPGYTFKPCTVLESSCPTPFLSLSPEQETFTCDEEITINVSPIEGKWIPVLNGVENPVQSLESSIGPFSACNTSWNFYLKHPDEASIKSNTVNMTWIGSQSCEQPTFDGNLLRIPKIKLDHAYHEAKLEMISGDPVQFELTELNKAADAPID